MKLTYKSTFVAACIGYICQALVINFAPLLFYTFENVYGISLKQIALLVTINFFVQLLVDAVAVKFSNKIGLKKGAVVTHILCAAGIAGLSIFPKIFPSPYTGLMVATVIAAIGGGLTEVLISPVVEALPMKRKSAVMSYLHSFYSWGQVIVVLFTTLYFKLFGSANWEYLPLLWAIVPFFNIFFFAAVPVKSLPHDENFMVKSLFNDKLFLAFVILMLGAGAAEMTMSQWASYFAEAGLKVSNTLGNLLGPCLFAVLMGLARIIYGTYSSKINMSKALGVSTILCILCYVTAAISKNPVISLIGCAVCGFSVGIMWPGVLSMSAEIFSGAGSALFALLALAGDIGCSLGPWLLGEISDFMINSYQKSNILQSLGFGQLELGIKSGLLFTTVFPITMLVIITSLKKMLTKK
ncbi:MAG: MFS transporter [Clostridia bacterium]|nr:MFS transporter [Clostridia bacterium]